MPHTYCVWYRVKDADDREAETGVRALQARLGCRTGVAGRLLKKRDTPKARFRRRLTSAQPMLSPRQRAAGANTWMELYEGVRGVLAFERQLQTLTEQFDVDMFLADSRHVECFIDGGAEAARQACVEGI